MALNSKIGKTFSKHFISANVLLVPLQTTLNTEINTFPQKSAFLPDFMYYVYTYHLKQPENLAIF